MRRSLLCLGFPLCFVSSAVTARGVQPDRTQLRVEFNYTRTVDGTTRHGPDNFETTRLTFSLAGGFSTLAEVLPAEGTDPLPHYRNLPTQTEITVAAQLEARVTLNRGPGDRPVETLYRYNGNRANFADLTLDVRSAQPVTPGALMADLEFAVPMTGSVVGLPAGLDADTAVCAIRNSPLRPGDGAPLCPVKFVLLPAAGPRPAESGPAGAFVARSYDVVHALSWGGAGVVSHGAPSQNWVGARATAGTGGLPGLVLEESKTWRDEQGVVTDTLRVSIAPAPITLKAVESPAAMDEATKDRHVKALLREAKKILGAVRAPEQGYTVLLKHLEKTLPELPAEDREWIAGDAVAALLEAKVLASAREGDGE